MMEDLLQRIEEADGEPLLLTGAGDAFSAGLDLKEIRQADAQAMRRFLHLLVTLVARLYHYPGPTVAAVNGHAIAGGCLLVLACDYRIATPDPRARIGLNEVALGLCFPPRLLAICRDRIPARHQHPILLGAALHPPQEALRTGLVDALADDPLARGEELLHVLARHPAAAYRATKRALRDGVDAVDPAAERAFEEEVLPVWSGPAIKERLDAVLARGR